uniref:Carn_acyltransf domain-containing protein n=1 Tax=Rhabditophanes sp. KR3021 TaxID=114890 RepID=A0AC35TMH0_9BILA
MAKNQTDSKGYYEIVANHTEIGDIDIFVLINHGCSSVTNNKTTRIDYFDMSEILKDIQFVDKTRDMVDYYYDRKDVNVFTKVYSYELAIQLAYFKDQGQFTLAYESASTRFFQNARTETLITVSEESCLFVRSMVDESVSGNVEEGNRKKWTLSTSQQPKVTSLYDEDKASGLILNGECFGAVDKD